MAAGNGSDLDNYLSAPPGSTPPVLTAAAVRTITGKTALTTEQRAQLKALYEAVTVGRVVASPEALGLLKSTLTGLEGASASAHG